MKKNKIVKILLFIFLAQGMSLFGTLNVDSLKQQLSEAKADTQKLKINLLLSRQFLSDNPDESLKFSRQALLFSKKTGKDEYKCYLNIGMALESKGVYGEAMDNYLNSLKVLERNNFSDKEKYMAKAYDCIGRLYVIQENFERALEYKNKALSIYKKINDVEGEAIASLNLGNVYYSMKKYNQAIEAYNFSAKVFEEIKDGGSAATALNNIGAIYFEEGKYEKSLTYFTKAYEIRYKTNDQAEMANSLNNMGEANGKLGKIEIAIEYCLKASKIAEKIGMKELMHYSLKNVSDLYEYKGDYKNSVIYHKLYEAIKDSISLEKNSKMFYELAVQYESEKKEKQIEIQNLTLTQQDLELNKRKIIIYSTGGGIALLALLSFFIFRGYRQKKQANIDLTEKNEIIEEKSRIVEEQHKDIIDSINYAKRIQQAVLSEEEHISEHLPPHFILFKPKDIVSGDFYWALEKSDYLYVAAADCTGHGVPGAFLTMLGISYLNEINSKEEIFTPAEILNQLRDKIVKELSRHGTTKDGMDISLMRMNLTTREIMWAGAFNPLWYTENGLLKEIKANKQPIGYAEDLKPFTNHIILNLRTDDSLYLFTDGLADQFGGPKGKKYKYKQLEEILISNRLKTYDEQKTILRRSFDNWMGGLEQVDDVTVIAIQVA